MKASVRAQYGPSSVLELEDVDSPVVKDDEVLVRVHPAESRRPRHLVWVTADAAHQRTLTVNKAAGGSRVSAFRPAVN